MEIRQHQNSWEAAHRIVGAKHTVLHVYIGKEKRSKNQPLEGLP